MIRKRYHFYGRVQGVGFRHTAIRAASSLGVTGWVRNERDGSVSMEAQGGEAALDKLVSTIKAGSYIRVESITVEDLPLVENETGFGVKWV